MNLSQATGKRVKELLFKNNMSAYKLRKITCLTEKTISDIIKGKNKDIRLSTIFLLASAFNMTISEFTDSPLFAADNIET